MSPRSSPRPRRKWFNGSTPAFATGSEITQLVALPGATNFPAAFKRYRAGVETPDWSAATWEITGTTTGYRVVARVPFAELGLTTNQPFRIEAAVTVLNGSRRLVLFESRTPYLNNENFCPVLLPSQ